MFLRRAVLPLLSVAALAGAATEFSISLRMRRHFLEAEGMCRFYVCEELRISQYAIQRQVEGGEFQLRTATRLFQDTLSRNPASAQSWSDLGKALAEGGSIAKAQLVFDKALETGNVDPQVLYEAGDFHLLSGDRHRGLRYLARALANAQQYEQAIFHLFASREVGIQEVLTYGLPEQKHAARAYLSFLIEQEELPDARQTWRWMAARNLTDPQSAAPYCSFLIKHKQYTEAADVWKGQVTGIEPEYGRTEFVFNGGFERESNQSAFDWNAMPVEHVEVARDSNPYSGKFAMRLRFGGANVDYRHLAQETVLPPGRYRFQAYIRSENITTDEGPYFQIEDHDNSKLLSVKTEQALGTTAWHPVTVTFVVSATELADIRVARKPSWKFDNKISGTVWVDQVSLTLEPLRR